MTDWKHARAEAKTRLRNVKAGSPSSRNGSRWAAASAPVTIMTSSLLRSSSLPSSPDPEKDVVVTWGSSLVIITSTAVFSSRASWPETETTPSTSELEWIADILRVYPPGCGMNVPSGPRCGTRCLSYSHAGSSNHASTRSPYRAGRT